MVEYEVMRRLRQISLIVFLGLLGYMPLHIFLSTWIGTSFGILEWTRVGKDVVLAAGFLCALVPSLRLPWFKDFLRSRLVWLILAYVGLTTLLAAVKPTDIDAEILGYVYNVRFLLYFLYAALLVRLFDADKVKHLAIRVVFIVSVPVLVFGIFQYSLLPDNALTHVGYSRENGVLPAFFIDDKPDLERAMSTIRDPNSFGSYLIIILSLAAAYWLFTRDKNIKNITAGLFAMSLLCLWFSFSRSAWIGAVLALITLAALYWKRQRSFEIEKKWLFVVLAGSVVLIGALYPLRNSYYVKNIIFHADQSTVLDDPNQLRTRFAQESIDSSLEEPLGYGPGTAGLASIRNNIQGTVLNENYYLQILYETGFIGLLLFLAILAVTGINLYKRSSSYTMALALCGAFVGLAFTNLLVHIWSNEAVAFTFWGLAGLLIFEHRNPRRTRVR